MQNLMDSPALRFGRRLALVALAVGLAGPAAVAEQSLVVTATAYNSLQSQTDENPSHGAWGDRLEPGMRAIAISGDLLELGLDRGMRVRVEGLPGEYVVLDRMPARWRKKIDIYMGLDVDAALAWGRREVRIRWRED